MTKQELYDCAKVAYYNGEPIMSDLEFDELERELGLENKGYIGTHHQKSYTIKHPFIMGSLSKVQIKENDDHTIDFGKYVEQIKTYLRKSLGWNMSGWFFEIGPKYDGCSFEVVIDKHLNLVSVSTRGDGEYGKDIKPWFEVEWKKSFEPKLKTWYSNNLEDHEALFLDKFVVRGECLIKKSIFKEKYANDFTIPRSFVSGCLNQDWEGTDKQIEMRNDLSWICYDYREVFENGTILPHGTITEVDYTPMCDEHRKKCIPTYSYKNLPGVSAYEGNGFMMFETYDGFEEYNLKVAYDSYDEYRKNICEFELDGFVIKPGVIYRLHDGDRVRQEDCVAIKFIPEIVDATLIDIEWNVGKTGEYFPTGIIEEVILGGKKVNRVSLHNYDYVVTNGTGIGSKMKVSLAGDIIPFVYDVVEKRHNDIPLPNETYEIILEEKSNCKHLMKVMSEEDKMYIDFIASVNALKIDGVGEKVAKKLFDICPAHNIIEYMDTVTSWQWKDKLEEGKSKDNIIAAIFARKKTLTLTDLILSYNFENCGEKNALWLAKKISNIDVDSKGIPTTIQDLYETYKNIKPAKEMGRDYTDDETKLCFVSFYKDLYNIPYMIEEKKIGIPVILTGAPSSDTKAQWMANHPEYVETTSWKECKILFTNDLDSTSSKMSKARKNGIDIKLYD